MSLNAKQLRAINWYTQSYDLRPELSAVPTMRFTKKTTGEKVEKALEAIVLEYSEWNEEDKKRRAADARKEREFQKREGK